MAIMLIRSRADRHLARFGPGRDEGQPSPPRWPEQRGILDQSSPPMEFRRGPKGES